MTDTAGNPENSDKSPFQEESIPENFFEGAQRGEVLSCVREAVAGGTSLVVITGEEGSGKTMMCRMLEQEGATDFLTVFFPRTVESFDDVLRIVAMRLGVKLTAAVDGKGGGALENITAVLKKEQKRLLVIFDEAENIYLATLERIRKMLDQITGSGARMHILFSGRKVFLENCEQLSICEFKNTDELHFELDPLSEVETRTYLYEYSDSLGDLEKTGLFNDENIKTIHGLAKGNFRMTNILAEELLKTRGEDTSFMVLLDSVKEDVEADEKTDGQVIISKRINRFSPYFLWIGGGLLCLLVLFFLVAPEGDPSDSDVSTRKPEIEKSSLVKHDGSIVIEKKVVLVKSRDSLEESSPVVQERLVVSLTESDNSSGRHQQVEEKKGLTEKKTDDAGAGKMVLPVESYQAQGGAVVPDKNIDRLLKIRPLKRKIAFHRNVGKRKLHVQPSKEEQKVVASTAQLTQLFQKRILAGAVWKRGEKDHMYTVQLMVLAAEHAEKNLKRMLSQENYRKQAGQFYIFKKADIPKVIFVFYGEYSTIAQARKARNTIAPFLREHKPYAISIKGAVAKVRK